MNPDAANANGRLGVDTVRRFLAGMGMVPREQAIAGGVAFHVTLDGPADQGVAQVHVDAERFVFHFIFPGYVPAERRVRVAEFLTRANWGLIEGNFELDFDNGALRYKVGIDFSHTLLAEPLVRNAILDGMNAIEAVVEALVAVVEGRLDPETAWRSVAPARHYPAPSTSKGEEQ